MMKLLPFTTKKKSELWSTIFDGKYPHAWSQSKVSPCGEIHMAAIPSSSSSNNNKNDDDENSTKEPHGIEGKPFDADENNIFVGIYDGNGSGRASRHVKDRLLYELSRLVAQNDNHMSEDIIKRAFSSVENTFMEYVKNIYQNNQIPIEDGSCCIASIIWGRTLYIANLGDSRAVLVSKVDKTLHIDQLTNDHSVSNEYIREELRARNPYDSEVVQYSEGIWNNSNIKVNRSIGYAHFKDHPINYLRRLPEIQQNQRITQVLVSAEPELHSRKIRKGDTFLILASHGFWNFMTNKNAANIVNRKPRDEIAKRLLSAALEKATEERGANSVYDDMIIIVLFFSEVLSQREDTPQTVVLHQGPSYLSNIIMASGKSDQSRQSLTSSSVPTHSQRVIGKEWDICLRSSEFRSDIHQSGQSDLMEIMKMMQEMQRVKIVQQQSLSAIQVLEIIGKSVKFGGDRNLRLEMEKSIFGDPVTEYISGGLMIEVAKQDKLRPPCMHFYVRYLHEKIICPQKLCNKFSFLNPNTISKFARMIYQELTEKEKDTTVTVFLESQKFKDKLIFAPCDLRSHWVLMVINVNAGTISYLDPVARKPTIDHKLVANFQKIFERYHKDKIINWINPECPKQSNPKDSGYYVMKLMKDIITGPEEIPVDYLKYLPDTYSNDDLDEVKTDWASYMINTINTTTDTTTV